MASIRGDIYWNKNMKEFVICLGPLNWTKRTVHLRPLVVPKYTYSTAAKNLVRLSRSVQDKLKVLYAV